MKILHVTNHFAPCVGGIERHVEDLCRNLKARGHEAEVLCLNKCGKSKKELPESEVRNGIKVTRLEFIDLHYYKIAKGTLEAIKKINPDVIHVHGIGYFSDFLLSKSKVLGKPVVVSTHGGIFHTKNIGFLKKIYFRTITKRNLNKAAKIIAVSGHDRKIFSGIVPQGDIEIIENSVDLGRFSAKGHNPGNNTFVFVGRISINKRIDLLMETFAEAASELGDFKLFIVGEDFDDLLLPLKKIVEEKGISKNVVFTGGLGEQELAELFKKTEFFVSASEYEGFGISAIEAMSCGLIPILNRIDSFREFVTSGKNGFITDFSDKRSAALAIIRASKLSIDEKTNISKNAVESSEKYSWKKQIAEFEKVYKEVAK